MSCILRISGESLNVDALLSEHPLPAVRVWRKGDVHRLKGKTHSDSGVNILASDADFDEINRQLAEATEFLKLHSSVIAKVVDFPGVQIAMLDFGLSALKPGSFAQFVHLPAELIELAAYARIAVEISLYACSEDNDE